MPARSVVWPPSANVAAKAQHYDFGLWKSGSRNSTALRAEGSIVEPTLRRSRAGDLAMWIIMYIAVMASLQAMGLEPSLVPIRTDDDDRPPCGDI